MKFIGADAAAVFCAVFNAPHGPLQGRRTAATYRKLDLSEKAFPTGPTVARKGRPEGTARLYGMVENIDTNFGRMLKRARRREGADNTIVIFLTKRPRQRAATTRFVGGRQASTRGGIQVPLRVGEN
ncbi:MAG: sulfatase-like hydrolase/transferase [Gemmataceae bacterium]